MRCTVLGCGTSTGVPLPGCRCAVCTSTSPKNFRNRTSSLIETNAGKKILIDASPDLRHQALRYDVREIHAVIITHCHADHILGLDDLRSFNFAMRSSIKCFGTKETLTELREKFRYIFEPNPLYQGGMLAQLELVEIEYHKPFEVCDTLVTAVPLWHGSVETTGLRIGGLAYATDCKRISDQSMDVFRGADYLLLDGLQYEQHRTHFTIDEAIEVSKKVDAKQTYLIHMTHTVDYDIVNPKLPRGVELAYDGLTFSF